MTKAIELARIFVVTMAFAAGLGALVGYMGW